MLNRADVDSASAGTFLWSVITFFILYNNLVPISLQVSIEVVRFFQAAFINSVRCAVAKRKCTYAFELCRTPKCTTRRAIRQQRPGHRISTRSWAR